MPKKQYHAVLAKEQRGMLHDLISSGTLALVVLALGVAWALTACDIGPAGGSMPSPGLPRGQAVFARYCNSCHPGGGRGSGPSLLIMDIADADIRSVIRKGKNQMPAFAPDQIPEDHLDDLIGYINSLK